MKRFVVCLLLLAISALSIGAQNSSSPEARINLLLQDDLYRNFDLISAESSLLTDEQRYRLFTAHENDPTTPFVLNLIVGLGVGSFVQGDIAGGLVGLGLGVVGLGTTMAGYFYLVDELANDPEFVAAADPISTDGFRLILLGTGVSLGGAIYRLVRTFTYSNRYNRDLQLALSVY